MGEILKFFMEIRKIICNKCSFQPSYKESLTNHQQSLHPIAIPVTHVVSRQHREETYQGIFSQNTKARNILVIHWLIRQL